MQDISNDSVKTFFDEWNVDINGVKTACEILLTTMASFSGVKLVFLHRPGISFSVRMLPSDNQEKIIALLDIIDDAPEERWASLCFDASRIVDVEELGDLVPQGLQGYDACCFDYDKEDMGFLAYLKARLQESVAV